MPQKQNESLFNESLEYADNLLNKAIINYVKAQWQKAIIDLSSAHKIFLAHKNISKVSVCLSLTGLIKYINKSESYYKSLWS